MVPAILFRRSQEVEDEFNALSALPVFRDRVFEFRSSVPVNSLVAGRYSVLPFYRELDEELALRSCRLVNSWDQHNYIADISRWVPDLGSLTPRTWTEWGSIPEGSYIVKGRTNSRKFQWKDQMFAPTRADVPRIAEKLLFDQLIAPQGLCVREYVPLRRFDTAINGLPISNEWRVFFYRRCRLAYGFYWSNFEDHKPYDMLPTEALSLLDRVAEIVAQRTNFFVVDIAEREDGGWIVIELNDGQMSGLSMVDPRELYVALAEALNTGQ